jgi:hypothetical protein
MDNAKLMWVVGVLEGEGHFGINRRKAGCGGRKKEYVQLRIECNMTDEDVIRKLHAWSGVGTVGGPYTARTQSNRKPYWRFFVNRKADAEALMRVLYPHLGSRRQGQIRAAFEVLNLVLPD